MAFDDINARLFRLRSGAPEGPSTAWRFKQETGSKGFIEPVNPPVTWNVFGSAGGGRQHGDARHGSVYGIPVLNQAAYDLDFATVSAGVEAAFDGDWFLGAALLGYSGDVDLNGLSDDRALGGAVYLSHHRSLPYSFTAYGDVMAGWLDHDIEVDRRVTGGTARGDTDAMVSIKTDDRENPATQTSGRISFGLWFLHRQVGEELGKPASSSRNKEGF